MDKQLITFVLVLLVALPHAVLANVGIVRGGEHGDFTRLTISTEKDVSLTNEEKAGSEKYHISLTPALVELDGTLLFQRLNANRVKAVTLSERGVEITLNCECEQQVTLENPRLIVIDIAERQTENAKPVPAPPKAIGVFPALPVLSDAKSTVFDLDFLVMERLNRKISSQIGQSSHISGFAQVAEPSFEVGLADEPTHEKMHQLKADSSHFDRCAITEAIWSSIGRSDEKRASGATKLLDQDNDALGSYWVIKFLSEGHVEEARMAVVATDATEVEVKQLEEFEKRLDGAASSGLFRFGDCDPLDDLLIAATHHGMDIPNKTTLELLNSFATVPVGLQLVLFPRLKQLFEDTSEALFPELVQHLEAERAMAGRVPLESRNSRFPPDPDRLAAISIELRGTEQEKASWWVSFDSYVDSQRYFDALAILSENSRLTDAEQEKAIAGLVDHLVTHGDSISFIQIALASLPDLEPQPSASAWARVSERMLKEGFVAEANSIGQSRRMVVAETVDAAPDQLSDHSTPMEAPLDQDALQSFHAQPDPSAVELWTVALAQQRLEAAQSLRQSLSEELSR